MSWSPRNRLISIRVPLRPSVCARPGYKVNGFPVDEPTLIQPMTVFVAVVAFWKRERTVSHKMLCGTAPITFFFFIFGRFVPMSGDSTLILVGVDLRGWARDLFAVGLVSMYWRKELGSRWVLGLEAVLDARAWVSSFVLAYRIAHYLKQSVKGVVDRIWEDVVATCARDHTQFFSVGSFQPLVFGLDLG